MFCLVLIEINTLHYTEIETISQHTHQCSEYLHSLTADKLSHGYAYRFNASPGKCIKALDIMICRAQPRRNMKNKSIELECERRRATMV